METTIVAEKSGTLANLQVSSGDNIDAKDLLFEIN
jgi:biotin carboxyl carrier protein